MMFQETMFLLVGFARNAQDMQAIVRHASIF